MSFDLKNKVIEHKMWFDFKKNKVIEQKMCVLIFKKKSL